MCVGVGARGGGAAGGVVYVVSAGLTVLALACDCCCLVFLLALSSYKCYDLIFLYGFGVCCRFMLCKYFIIIIID